MINSIFEFFCIQGQNKGKRNDFDWAPWPIFAFFMQVFIFFWAVVVHVYPFNSFLIKYKAHRFYSSPFIVAMSTYCMLLLIARVAYKSEHSFSLFFNCFNSHEELKLGHAELNVAFSFPSTSFSMFAGYIWKGLHAALQLCTGHVLPPHLWRVRLSSRIHWQRLRTEWAPQD